MTARVPVATLLEAADVVRSVGHDLAEWQQWAYQRATLDGVAATLERAAREGQETNERYESANPTLRTSHDD